MLPPPPTPAPLPARNGGTGDGAGPWPIGVRRRRWPQAAQAVLLRGLLLVALLLPLGLVGCAGPGQPPRSVLLDALALQIQLTQGSIAQALELEPPGLPQVSRVRVEEIGRAHV